MSNYEETRIQQRQRLTDALDRLGHAVEVAFQRIQQEVEALDHAGDQSGLAGSLEALQWGSLQPGLHQLGEIQRRLDRHCLPETAAA